MPPHRARQCPCPAARRLRRGTCPACMPRAQMRRRPARLHACGLPHGPPGTGQKRAPSRAPAQSLLRKLSTSPWGAGAPFPLLLREGERHPVTRAAAGLACAAAIQGGLRAAGCGLRAAGCGLRKDGAQKRPSSQVPIQLALSFLQLWRAGRGGAAHAWAARHHPWPPGRAGAWRLNPAAGAG